MIVGFGSFQEIVTRLRNIWFFSVLAEQTLGYYEKKMLLMILKKGLFCGRLILFIRRTKSSNI